MLLGKAVRLAAWAGGAAPIPTPQPDFDNVVWLFGMEGGETDAIIDESARAASMIRGTGTQTTDEFKFGVQSLHAAGGIGAVESENNNAAHDIAAQDFSIETFFQSENIADDSTIAAKWHSSSNRSWVFYWDAGNDELTLITSTGGAAIASTLTAAFSPTQDVWYHIAVCRAAGVVRFFVDGLQVGSDITNTEDFFTSTRQAHVGFSNSTINNLEGYMDEFRWVIGEGIYTQDFVAPTQRHPRQDFQADEVLVLTMEGADGATTTSDSSIADHGAATFSGTAQLTTTKPIAETSSLLLDGNSDLISYPDDTDWDSTDEDFTIEATVAWESAPSSTQQIIVAHDTGSSGGFGWRLEWFSGDIRVVISTNGTSYGTVAKKSLTVVADQAYHIALVKKGSGWTIYIDGEKSIDTQSPGNAKQASQALTIGARGGGTRFYFGGRIDDVRLTKAVARFDADYALPNPGFELP